MRVLEADEVAFASGSGLFLDLVGAFQVGMAIGEVFNAALPGMPDPATFEWSQLTA